MVANYTNKHVTFNNVQCIGHMEPPIDHMSQASVNSVITQKMMDHQGQLDTFTPPLHHFSLEVKQCLDELLESFKYKFVKDETNIGKMQIETGNSETIPYCYETLWLG